MRIAIAAPCTGTKRAIADAVSLGAVAPPDLPARARFPAWAEAIERAVATGPTVPAGDLYSGQTWASTADLFRAGATAGFDVAPHVISAGLGLLGTGVRVPSYSATFTRGARDAVSNRRGAAAVEDHRIWWASLGAWRDTTLASLAGDVDAVLVAATPAYAAAIRDDLRSALREAPTVLLTTSVDPDPEIAARTVTIGRSHRRPDGLVSTSDQALPVAVAAEALRRLGPGVLDPDALRTFLDRHRGSEPFHEPRTPIDDVELDRFIVAALSDDRGASWSALHGRLRYELGREIGTIRFKRHFELAGGRFGRRNGSARARKAVSDG